MKTVAVAFLGLIYALAESKIIAPFERIPQKIVGGTETTIQQYPYGAAMLYNQGWSSVYDQTCGGTILTSRYILSAAHCYNAFGVDHNPLWWRVRVGSSTSNAEGVVHNIQTILNHPNYSMFTYDSDISLLRTATVITYSATVAAGSIAGANYIIPDNAPVWAIGWGSTASVGGPFSTNLRHVQIWTVNQNVCNTRYGGLINQNMLCSGWLDVGGRGQCSGDSGSPLLHNGVVVGVCSFSANGCANPDFPGVNARVSMFTNWILANAQ